MRKIEPNDIESAASPNAVKDAAAIVNALSVGDAEELAEVFYRWMNASTDPADEATDYAQALVDAFTGTAKITEDRVRFPNVAHSECSHGHRGQCPVCK